MLQQLAHLMMHRHLFSTMWLDEMQSDYDEEWMKG